jgi:Protein of unknown function DUF88.
MSKKTKEYQRFFLVDYENVHCSGLDGIKNLSDKDCVRIYYREERKKEEKLTLDFHNLINKSKAHFKYIEAKWSIENAADFWILFDIEKLLKKNKTAEYFIVSKDTDFDKDIEKFCEGKWKVKRISTIDKRDEQVKNKSTRRKANASKNVSKKTNNREAQIRSFFGQHFKEPEYTKHKEQIIRVLLDGKTKQQVNNGLMKIYRQSGETVGRIVKKCKPLLKELPGK